MRVPLPFRLSEDLLRRAKEWGDERNLTLDQVLEIAVEKLFAWKTALTEDNATVPTPERREWLTFDDPDEESRQ